MTQPWRPETGISREKYNKWVEGLHDQNYRGSIAHPSVLERMRREGYPWNKPWDMNFPTSQIPDLPPIPSQAPRPEGFQRAITGLADYITGNKWDFDQRGRGGQRQWDAPNDLTVTQGAEQGVREGGGILDQVDPRQQESRNFLGRFLGKLGEIWNKPIMAPNITKQEHDRMIRGENTGPNNWDSRY